MMAIWVNSLLISLPNELQHFEQSDIGWLENYLYLESIRISLPLGLIFTPMPGAELWVRVQNISQEINRRSQDLSLIPRILDAHKNSLISKEDLDWIKAGDARLGIKLISLLSQMKTGTENQPLIQGIRSLNVTPINGVIDEVVKAFNNWAESAVMKQDWLDTEKESWSQILQQDKRYIKWLTGNKNGKKTALDEGQLDWALNYLRERNMLLSVIATTPDERFAAVAASIDAMTYYHTNHNTIMGTNTKTISPLGRINYDDINPAIGKDAIAEANSPPFSKNEFIDKMKRAWSQKKFRDSGNSVKQYHLPLTVTSKDQLDWMVKTSGYKPTQILAALIDRECKSMKAGASSLFAENQMDKVAEEIKQKN